MALILGVSTSLLSSASAAAPQHWVSKGTGVPDEAATAVGVDPFDDQVVYVGLDGFVFRTDDGGDTWGPVLTFPRGLAEDPSLSTSDTDASALDGSFDEDGAVRATATDDIDAEADAVDDADLDDLPDGSLDAGRARTADPDDPSTFGVPGRFDPGVRAITFVPHSRGALLVATPRGLYRTTNSGGSFERLSVPGAARENDIRDVVVDPNRPTRLFVATAAGLFISKDGGVVFDRASGRLGTTGIVCLAVDAVGTLVVGSERGLLRTRDGGDTFTDLLLRGQAAFPLIHAVAVAEAGSVLYAGVLDGLYAAERNSAILEHYEGMPSDPPTAISPDPREAGGVVVGTRDRGGGAFASTDIGLTPAEIEPLPAQSVFSIARETKNSARVWAATDRGLFRLEPGTGIRVAADDLARLRERFAKEPGLSELTELALSNSRVDVDFASASARAGWAALLPRLNAGYQFDAGDTDQARTQFVFIIGIGQPPTSDPNAEQTDRFGDNGLIVIQPARRLDHRVWVNLTWQLDRVILSPQSMTLGRNASTIVQNRRTMANSVRSFYVARRRLVAQVELEALKATTAQQQLARVHKELQILEAEAHLAALVGADLFDPESSVRDLDVSGADARRPEKR